MTRAKPTLSASPQPGRSAKTAHNVEKNPVPQTSPAAGSADARAPAAIAAKPGSKKEKRLRVSHRMTETQSALLDQLKSRSLRLGHAARKGDVVFAGLQLLNKLSEQGFEAAILPLLNPPTFKKNSARKKTAAPPAE